MKKDFVATTESGEARHFTLETQGADEVIFTENGQSTAFKIVSQSASHWQLCDSAGQTFTFALAQASEKRFLQVGLKTQSFVLQDERARRRGAAVSGGASSANRIVAPMPGRIVRLEVAEGQTVVAGQGLVVVEAMKMENEFKAQKPGTVKKIHVTAGQVVDAKTVLLEME